LGPVVRASPTPPLAQQPAGASPGVGGEPKRGPFTRGGEESLEGAGGGARTTAAVAGAPCKGPEFLHALNTGAGQRHKVSLGKPFGRSQASLADPGLWGYSTVTLLARLRG